MTAYIQGPPSNLPNPPNSFAFYDANAGLWPFQAMLCPRLSRIITGIYQALTANPNETWDTVRRHYFFIPPKQYITPQTTPQQLQSYNNLTFQFFTTRFPQICLHNKLDDPPVAIGDIPMLGLHDRGTHNSMLFLDTSIVWALETTRSREYQMTLTILLVSTLYHELAHCFWSALHGEDSLTPERLNWNGTQRGVGESGFVVEGSLLGCEVWPAMTPEGRIGNELIWRTPDRTSVSYILTERKIRDLWDRFMAIGHFGPTPLFDEDDIFQVVLRSDPDPSRVVHGHRYRMARRTHRYRVDPAAFEGQALHLRKRGTAFRGLLDSA
ncbi:hypothetical protein B0H16DRAFT_559424 [Mycena metata]|uniref:Uncharacterized protein n=1 Tax=Mycena metata TaxID=1033252 RepID=A0AAD7JDA5_9AGAR|nr:hypothetical protein B0H16DRAFT_559424 [Mycena metata]